MQGLQGDNSKLYRAIAYLDDYNNAKDTIHGIVDKITNGALLAL